MDDQYAFKWCHFDWIGVYLIEMSWEGMDGRGRAGWRGREGNVRAVSFFTQLTLKRHYHFHKPTEQLSEETKGRNHSM